MKASADQQRRLLDLQSIDTGMRRVQHQAKSLPEHAELAEVESSLATTKDALVASRTAVSDLERELVKAEADVQQVRDRAARDRERIDSGQGSAKDLVGLQSELESLARRQSTLEEVELGVMERLEEARTELDRHTEAATEQQTRHDALAAVRTEKVEALRGQYGELSGQRDEVRAEVEPALLSLYQKVLDHSGGLGAAELVDKRCGGCRLELNPVDLAAATNAPADEVVQCEMCNVILVRSGD